MKDVVVSCLSRCPGAGMLSDFDVGRANPIKGEECRTNVSKEG